MKFLRWLESKFITGEVVRDYGKLGELIGVNSPGSVSLVLCKRREQLQLTIRTNSYFEMNWYRLNASADLADKLAEVAEDIRRLVANGSFQVIS
jgi:hypothetical protein